MVKMTTMMLLLMMVLMIGTLVILVVLMLVIIVISMSMMIMTVHNYDGDIRCKLVGNSIFSPVVKVFCLMSRLDRS